MSLPTTVPGAYTSLIKDETGDDRRLQHMYINDTEGSDVDIAILWSDLDSDFMQEGVAHVTNSSGVITDTFVSDSGGSSCELTIPDGGYLFVGGQRPSVYASSAISITDVDLEDSGTSGDNLHPYSSVLTAEATNLLTSANAIPLDDYSPAGGDEDVVCTTWRAEIIGRVAWTLGHQVAGGGIEPTEHGGSWSTARGWSYVYGNSMMMTYGDTINCPENPFYGAITDRVKGMMFWELSRMLENGCPVGWSGAYTGGLGLANSLQVPWLAITTYYDGLSSGDKAKVFNALQIIGHTNAVMPLESTANQSFHFIENLADFIKAWKYVRSGESDETQYDDILREQIRVMFERTGYVMGSVGEGRAWSEQYGFDYSYHGLQRASIVGAIHALTGDDALSDVRDDLIAAYEDGEKFFDPLTGVDAQGEIRVATGPSSRQRTPNPQYGDSASMIGISQYAGRDASIDDSFEDPVTGEKTTNRNWFSTRSHLEQVYPVTPLDTIPIPSTVRDFGYASNGNTAYYRSPTYFAGYCERATWGLTTHVNFDTPGDTDGERLGESGEYGGPFSDAIEMDGTSLTGGTGSGVISGQGAIETLSIRGIMVWQSRNLSPLTVHGLYGDNGTRYFTADPNSQSSTWDAEAKTLTTTFELYTITGTFTRVLDFSNPSFISVSITSPADPGSGPDLYEVIPQSDVEGTPQIARPEGFSVPQYTTFGTESDEPNVKWMRSPVSWDSTLTYTIQEHLMSSTDLSTGLVIHYEFDETAANSAPGGLDFADSVGSNHLTDGGNCTYAQGTHGNVGESFAQPSTASHPPRIAIGDMDWNIPTAGDFTIACWVYQPPTHSALEFVWGMINTDQSRGINLKMDSPSTDELYFVINGSGYITSGSTESLVTEEYNHIVVSHEHGVGLKLYINNVLSDTIAHASQILPVTTAGLSLLGLFASGSATLQNGRMAQFSVWNERALTADEVSAHYNNGDGLAYASYPASSDVSTTARRLFLINRLGRNT